MRGKKNKTKNQNTFSSFYRNQSVSCCTREQVKLEVSGKLQYPALISMWGLCSLILALVMIGAYCVPCVIVL